VDNAARSKMGVWKMHEWTIRQHVSCHHGWSSDLSQCQHYFDFWPTVKLIEHKAADNLLGISRHFLVYRSTLSDETDRPTLEGVKDYMYKRYD